MRIIYFYKTYCCSEPPPQVFCLVLYLTEVGLVLTVNFSCDLNDYFNILYIVCQRFFKRCHDSPNVIKSSLISVLICENFTLCPIIKILHK